MKLSAVRSMVVVLLWLSAAAAQAEDKPTLAALAVGLEQPQPSSVAGLQAAAGQAVLRTDRFEGQDLVDRLDIQGAAARREAHRKAVARFQAAREAFDNLDLDKATQLFGEAADLFRDADLRAYFDEHINARIWHAASRHLNGDKQGAQKEFARLFVQAPRVVLDRQAFPPELLAAAERSRAAVTAESSLNLAVSSVPIGLAWVDGRLAGPTPVTVNHLPIGEHSVVVGAPGFQLASVTSGGPQARLTLSRLAPKDDLDSIRAQVATAFPQIDRSAKLAAAARALGVDQLLVVALEGQRPGVLHLLRVSADGRPLAAAEGNAGAEPIGELSRLLPGVLAKDAPEAAQRALLGSERRTGESSAGVDLPKLAPWVGGGALLLAGGALAFGLFANHDRVKFQRTPSTDTVDSAQLASATKTNALIADVCGVTAAVAAVTAASFYFTPGLWGWHPRPKAKPADRQTPAPSSSDDDLRESLRVAPIWLPDGAGVMASARF